MVSDDEVEDEARVPRNITYSLLFFDLLGYNYLETQTSVGNSIFRRQITVVCQARGNRSNEIPCTWYREQLKRQAGISVSRILALSTVFRSTVGGRRHSLILSVSQKKRYSTVHLAVRWWNGLGEIKYGNNVVTFKFWKERCLHVRFEYI